MRLFQKCKDGGPFSPVDAYILIEIKHLFSIMLLKFNKGGREVFHTHAFNAFTWFIKGWMTEENMNGTTHVYRRSVKPKFTPRTQNHRVRAHVDSWCLTVRGPWSRTWTEHHPEGKVTLGWGRKVLNNV